MVQRQFINNIATTMQATQVVMQQQILFCKNSENVPLIYLYYLIYLISGLLVDIYLNKTIQYKPQNMSTLHYILMFTLSAAYDFSDIVNLLGCSPGTAPAKRKKLNGMLKLHFLSLTLSG